MTGATGTPGPLRGSGPGAAPPVAFQDQAEGGSMEGNAATDPGVVRRAQRGDRDAFEALYRQWFGPVYDFLLRMVRERELAADLAQETFLRAMHRIDTLRKPAAFKSWVFSIAYRTALNRLEREKRSSPSDPLPGGDAGLGPLLAEIDEDRFTDPAELAEVRDAAALVWEAAAALDERTFTVMQLHLRQGLESAEIAQVLEVSTGAAYTMVSRMKSRLGQAIGAYLLARRGSRDCPELATLVAPFDLPPMTPELRRRVDGHATGCEVCEHNRRRMVAPHQILAAYAAAAPPDGLVDGVWDAIGRYWDEIGPPSRRVSLPRRLLRFGAGTLIALLLVLVAIPAAVWSWTELGESPAAPVVAPTLTTTDPAALPGETTTTEAVTSTTAPPGAPTTTLPGTVTSTTASPGVATASTTTTTPPDGTTATTGTTSTTTSTSTTSTTSTTSSTTTSTTSTTTSTTTTAPPDTPPTARIDNPRDGDSFVAVYHQSTDTWSALVRFRGTATDAEDPASALTVEWRSDRDGVLGTGIAVDARLSATACPVTEHRITSSVTDTAGNTTRARITVSVLRSNC